MAAPIFISDKAKRMMARTKPAQTDHYYHVKVNNTRDEACRCTHDDVAGLPPATAKLGQIPAHKMAQAGIDPVQEILKYCDKMGARLEKIFDGLGLELPLPNEPGSESPLDQIIGALRWLDAAITVAEYHSGGIERAQAPRADGKRAADDPRANAQRPNIFQPRGAEARNSPISNMSSLTFAPEHQREEEDADFQRQPYVDSPQSAVAQSASALRVPLSRAERRSMTSPPYAPVTALEDRFERGEENPREVVNRFSRGNPYRGNGVSSAPDAPAPQGGGGRERTKLNETTGRSKYAYGNGTYSTGDSTPSTGDIIRALARKERAMMKQIADEIGIVMKSRWH